MIRIEHTVKDPNGMHARPAGLLVKALSGISSDIVVSGNGKQASAKKIISLLSLAIKCGDTIEFTVSGEDEHEAAELLKAYLETHL